MDSMTGIGRSDVVHSLHKAGTVLTKIRADWTSHVARVRDETTHKQSAPALSASMSIADSLRHLEAEVQSINSRLMALRSRHFGVDDLSLQRVLADHTRRPTSTETTWWQIKTAIAGSEHFLADCSSTIEWAEDWFSKDLNSMMETTQTLLVREYHKPFQLRRLWHESLIGVRAQVEHHRPEDGELETEEYQDLLDALLVIEEFDDEPGFRKDLDEHDLTVYTLLGNVSCRGSTIARQTLITEYFEPR